ncbi:hypothetical protein AKJ36_03415 [candidate division MSBL1 archaeon SCGC-AAA259I07]|uniref:ABC transporter domain-containing protein n=1 Tax=candidate division MSBL1 archaeon SCGC-AAA259I07 TaxID=1698266 RepID=A0A133UIS4_9EURY|nr:hypothetical protein AKJ36_03415 [candidate division MSBL1 archaeon SCGC-AAA259I07]
MSKAKNPFLKCEKVTKRFGGITALSELEFEIKKKETLGIIGPNGAGKTTLFNVLSGVHKPDSGTIKLKGEEITGKEPYQIARKGIGRTFQSLRLFSNLNVLENVMSGTIFTDPIRKETDQAEELLRKLGIEKVELIGQKMPQDLPTDKKRVIELARVLVRKPKILLLDEFMAGLNPKETDKALQMLKKIKKKENLTMALIEHNIRAIMNIAERVFVLHSGRKLEEGPPKEIKNSEKVKEVYLGE